jgi:hypothetical protein
MIKTIDDFVIDRFDGTVQFAQDWLFLSQRQIERGVMILYVLISLLSISLLVLAKHTFTIEIFADSFLFLGMWFEYKQSSRARTLRRISQWGNRICWLVCWLFIFGVSICPTPTPATRYMHIYYVLGPIWAGLRTMMTYITVLDVDGVRGRAAKLSWEKLKELFGTTPWVPQPQGEEG